MNRFEFMRELEVLLQDVPPAERDEALQYYNSYFDDAGASNEAQVIQALGNPAKVAASIKRDAGILEFQEMETSDTALATTDQLPMETPPIREDDHTDTTYPAIVEKIKSNPNKPVLIIVLILAGIISIPIIAVIMGGLGGLVGAWVGLCTGVVGATAGVCTASFAVLASAVYVFPSSPILGIALVAVFCICLAVGFLLLAACVALIGIATPAIVRLVVGLVKKIVNFIIGFVKGVRG